MTDPTKTYCAAFGCKRWTRKTYGDGVKVVFLCKDHWPTVPKRLRSLYSKRVRRAKKYDTHQEWSHAYRLWLKCVAAADRNIGI